MVHPDGRKADGFGAARPMAADGVLFEAPLAAPAGAEGRTEGIRGPSRVVSEIAIRRAFVGGRDAPTRYGAWCLRSYPEGQSEAEVGP